MTSGAGLPSAAGAALHASACGCGAYGGGARREPVKPATGHHRELSATAAAGTSVSSRTRRRREQVSRKPRELSQPMLVDVRGLPPHPPWDCQVGTELVKSAFGVLRIGCAAS